MDERRRDPSFAADRARGVGRPATARQAPPGEPQGTHLDQRTARVHDAARDRGGVLGLGEQAPIQPGQLESTSTQLLQNQDIRDATANYVVDQLYANVDVAGLLKQGLPPQLQGLAGPAAGALRNAAVKGVDLALQRPRIQGLWATANRAADQAFIAVVNGGKGPVGVKQGVVTLDLASIIDNVASRLGLPSDIGNKLPPSIGNLTILKSDQIKLIQNLGQAIKSLALLLTILVPLLYALVIGLSTDRRRRMLMMVGFSIVFAGVVAFLLRHLLVSGVTNSLVKDESVKPAAQATMSIATGMINEIAGAFVFVGLILSACAVFAGPARWATDCRRALAPHLRDHPGWAFATTALVMVLIFIWNPIPATGKPAGIIVFFLLAMLGTEVLRRETLREFPDARRGDAAAAMRARLQTVWRRVAARQGGGDRFRCRDGGGDGHAAAATRSTRDPAVAGRAQRGGVRRGQGQRAPRWTNACPVSPPPTRSRGGLRSRPE